jgi:hypothetical protein
VATLAYAIFFAGALSFFPVILRRLGADTNQLALYVTLTYLGSVLTPLGLRLTRNLPQSFGCPSSGSAPWVSSRGILASIILMPIGAQLLLSA